MMSFSKLFDVSGSIMSLDMALYFCCTCPFLKQTFLYAGVFLYVVQSKWQTIDSRAKEKQSKSSLTGNKPTQLTFPIYLVV